MKKHEAPRTRPRRLPWVRGQILGEWFTFKLPPPSVASAIAKRYVAAMEEHGPSKPGYDLGKLEEAFASVVVECWDDESWAFEGGQPAAQELWEFGWNPAVVAHVAKSLIEDMHAHCVWEADVAKQVDFSSARGVTGSSSSTSGGPTSVTSGPGTGSPTPSASS